MLYCVLYLLVLCTWRSMLVSASPTSQCVACDSLLHHFPLPSRALHSFPPLYSCILRHAAHSSRLHGGGTAASSGSRGSSVEHRRLSISHASRILRRQRGGRTSAHCGIEWKNEIHILLGSICHARIERQYSSARCRGHVACNRCTKFSRIRCTEAYRCQWCTYSSCTLSQIHSTTRARHW
jgi:hypothetical protein